MLGEVWKYDSSISREWKKKFEYIEREYNVDNSVYPRV